MTEIKVVMSHPRIDPMVRRAMESDGRTQITVQSVETLEEAFQLQSSESAAKVVVVDKDQFNLGAEERNRLADKKFKLVVCSTGAESEKLSRLSFASPHCPIHFSSMSALSATLGKALSISALANRFSIRRIESLEDYKQYLQLRYKVWLKERFLNPDLESIKSRECKLELHFSDRFSVPFGAFDASGRIVGCVRVVRKAGQNHSRSIRQIETIMSELERNVENDREADLGILKKQFAFPAGMIHPFDVLESFQGFREWYRDNRKKNMAEVSRVVVDEDTDDCVLRKRGLGEALVDTAVYYALQKQAEFVFLACKKSKKSFYERSGFSSMLCNNGIEPLPVECDEFIGVKVPAIAMIQDLAELSHTYQKLRV